MQIVIIDNYDSFTYNLYHLIEAVLLPGDSVSVFRNDEIIPGGLERYDKIVISPGPGLPLEAGITCDTIRMYGHRKSILGVCLGHQAIGVVYGAELQNLEHVMHGKQINTHIIDNKDLFFKGLPGTCSCEYSDHIGSGNLVPVFDRPFPAGIICNSTLVIDSAVAVGIG